MSKQSNVGGPVVYMLRTLENFPFFGGNLTFKWHYPLPPLLHPQQNSSFKLGSILSVNAHEWDQNQASRVTQTSLFMVVFRLCDGRLSCD